MQHAAEDVQKHFWLLWDGLQSHWEQKILTDTAAEVKPELLTAERSFEMLMAAGRICVNLGCLTICAA